jgi:DNA-binding Xre family transcriptional regulator
MMVHSFADTPLKLAFKSRKFHHSISLTEKAAVITLRQLRVSLLGSSQNVSGITLKIILKNL